ncbi:MAG: transcriptional regulator PpsR [Hyphomicrobiales bacterium]|nr:transcriptional regulator PpsR [Hyphomicrobiales bacterium]
MTIHPTTRDAMTQFKAPHDAFADIDPKSAAALIAASSDIALILDGDGVIRDMSATAEDLPRSKLDWVGRPFIETVTVESRPKVMELLSEAAKRAAPRARQVNHPVAAGQPDFPVRYSAVQIGDAGHVVAVGRDLRAVASLQQRLVEAQQSMEREYARLRQAETRYRLLFQISSEAVLIVEAATGRISEANPASLQALKKPAAKLIGKSFADEFGQDAPAVHELLAGVKASGRPGGGTVRLADGAQAHVSASLFRQQNASYFLIRLALSGAGRPGSGSPSGVHVMRVIAAMPDAFVVTDPDRKILMANPAFLDMAQVAAEEQAKGALIDRWVGRPGADAALLASQLREHGSARRFATIVRGELGAVEDVEVSGVSVLGAEQPCLGLTMRMTGGRPAEGRSGRELPRTLDQMTELIGRVPLKDLVRETTDVIERLCIEAALELTGDNRASAADMLGLSRQSLYAKLRRHGLGDLGSDDD